MKNKLISVISVAFLVLFSFLIVLSSHAMSRLESNAENYFAKIKNNSAELEKFLYAMPKGGDLHSHQAGATMAENLIHYAQGDRLCLDLATYKLSVNPNCAEQYILEVIAQNPTIFNAIIDAWSMRNFQPGKESGHDHFFAAMEKYSPIKKKHSVQILNEIVARAAKQNILYLELMVNPDNKEAIDLGKKVGWKNDFAKMVETLKANGLNDVVNIIANKISEDETAARQSFQCETGHPLSGCKVTVRYLYQVLRNRAPEEVFAQLLAGFETASQDKRMIGINMVQAEDGAYSMQDYQLHMRMVRYLHQLYPQVKISLHAGELIPGLVPDAGLRFHINEAVTVAHANRIGHGVAIQHETNYQQLLQHMLNNNVSVEINLSSNEAILGVKGQDHPLKLYMQHGIPVTLSTDDEGVFRTNLTQEYKKSVLYYDFTYLTLKKLVRNSIEYSFLPGDSLWVDNSYTKLNPACAHDADIKSISNNCQTYLNTSEKAKLQWELEKQFFEFEKRLAN